MTNIIAELATLPLIVRNSPNEVFQTIRKLQEYARVSASTAPVVDDEAQRTATRIVSEAGKHRRTQTLIDDIAAAIVSKAKAIDTSERERLGYDPVAHAENMQWLKEWEAQRLPQSPDPNAAIVPAAASPAAPQEDVPCPFSPDSELYWPPSAPTPSLPNNETTNLMTLKEWESLSPESRFRINAYFAERSHPARGAAEEIWNLAYDCRLRHYLPDRDQIRAIINRYFPAAEGVGECAEQRYRVGVEDAAKTAELIKAELGGNYEGQAEGACDDIVAAIRALLNDKER